MKTSTFQIILLVVFGAAAVVGVLVFAMLTSTGSQSSTGPVIIWGTLDRKVIGQMIQDSGSSDPTLATVSYIQKDPVTFEDELTRALASGTGPDLVIFDQNMGIKDASEFAPIPYTEVTQSQFQNLFIDATNPLMMTNGIIGLPLLADPMVMYWNKDLLASAGLTQPPTQWGQLFTTPMQSLTVRDESGAITQSLIAMGEYENVDHAKDLVSTLIMQVGGSIVVPDSTGAYTAALTRPDPTKTVAGVPAESVLRFYTEFANPAKDHYSWNRSLPSSMQAFAQGTLALYVGFASEEPTITATNPNIRFAVARLPQSTVGGVTTAHIFALGISRTAKNPVGAKVVAYTLVTKQASTMIAKGYHMVSPRRDALQDAIAVPVTSNSAVNNAIASAVGTTTPESAIIAQSATIARTWPDPDPEKTNDIFRAMIEDVTSGALQVPESVSRANTQLLTITGNK